MGASCHCAIHAQEAFSMIHQASWGQRNGACSLQGCLWALSPHSSPWATEAQVESKPQLGLGLPLTPTVYSVSCTGGLDEVSMHCLKPRVSHDLWNLSYKKPVTACPPAGGGRGLPVRPPDAHTCTQAGWPNQGFSGFLPKELHLGKTYCLVKQQRQQNQTIGWCLEDGSEGKVTCISSLMTWI